MAKFKLVKILALIFLLSGCAATKEEVGAFVKDSVIASISQTIDQKLAAKNTSIADISSNLSLRDAGGISSLVKDLVESAVITKGSQLIENKISNAKLINSDQLQTSSERFFNWLIITGGGGLLALFAKIMHSMQQNSVTKSRLAVVENLLSTSTGDGNSSRTNNNNNLTGSLKGAAVVTIEKGPAPSA